jgi:hypothetical protein
MVLEPSARFLVSFETLTSFGDAIGLVTTVAVSAHKPADSVPNISTLKGPSLSVSSSIPG